MSWNYQAVVQQIETIMQILLETTSHYSLDT